MISAAKFIGARAIEHDAIRRVLADRLEPRLSESVAPICSAPLHRLLRAFDSMNTGTEIAETMPIKATSDQDFDQCIAAF